MRVVRWLDALIRNSDAMMYLIDTDWVIDYLDGDEEVVRRVKDLLPSGIGISVVSLAEL